MRVDFPCWRLSLPFALLLAPRAGLAAEEAIDSKDAPPSVAASDKPTPPEVQEAEDVDPRAGYIPGYGRSTTSSLSPLVPRTGTRPGGVTPYHAPSEDEDWQFKFWGYASASLRMSSGSRENPTADQSGLTLHEAPRIPDFYGAFNGTNATPGSWIDLHFQYGNPTVQSHVTLTTWKPARATEWNDVRSQNLIDQAYLVFDVPAVGGIPELHLNWTAGAFRNTYGGLGQYGAGQYNTIIIGMPYGVGETLSVKYDLNEDYSLHFEHGFMGRLGKIPPGGGPSPFDSAQSGGRPSSWVNHAHVGISKTGEIPFVLSLHYMNNWSQDERDQVDDPQTYWVNERNRADGTFSVYGAEFRMVNNYLGNFALAAAYADAQDAQLLTGVGFFGAVSGEELTKRFLGQRGEGTGKMFVGGFEYNLSWAKLLYHPDEYWGEGPDLITSVFSNFGSIDSPDPDANGRGMFKAGAEVTYRFVSWAGISGRYDHVIPNTKDDRESFDVISPKLLFRSNWLSHEQVTVSYTRWFYGSRTHAEFPFELPRDELDEEMFALHFGMWW